MAPSDDDILREIEELRNALKGRTVSCSCCNWNAKRHDEMCEAVRHFAEQELLFAEKAFFDTGVSYGSERPALWRKAFRELCRMANVKT